MNQANLAQSFLGKMKFKFVQMKSHAFFQGNPFQDGYDKAEIH